MKALKLSSHTIGQIDAEFLFSQAKKKCTTFFITFRNNHVFNPISHEIHKFILQRKKMEAPGVLDTEWILMDIVISFVI
jgi:hypothetical protein